MNVAVAAHPTPDPRVVRGLEALNLCAKRDGWTRSQKRRAVEALHVFAKLMLESKREAAG